MMEEIEKQILARQAEIMNASKNPEKEKPVEAPEDVDIADDTDEEFEEFTPAEE